MSMDLYGKALLDAFHKKAGPFIIHREDGFKQEVPVKLFFRSPQEFSSIENLAVKLCVGNTLDHGAGTGVHCLALQNNNISVCGLDISSDAV